MARTRAERRHLNIKKALRKQAIAKHYPLFIGDERYSYYDNLHQYSKNKIHCSCPMCSTKTNNRGNYGVGSKNWKHSDLIKIARFQEEYLLWQEN